MRVLIRADASIAIGSGHVARCLTLANALRKRGADVQFACRQLSGHLLQRLREQGYTAFGLPELYPQEQGSTPIEVSLPWQADIEALAEALRSEQPFDWLIVDHYDLDARWERAAGRFASGLMAIDDLANRPHAVDVLLDQNFSAQVTDSPYAQWIPGDCQALLGPHFALLRDEFQCQPIAINPWVERVLVNFGGFDAACQVHATMHALQGFDDMQVDFVAGLHNPQWEAMIELARGRPNWRLHGLVDDFFGLMQQADLFIGAGGGTTWERAALGLPTVCISVAHNQQLNARLLAEAGIHLYLGPHEQLDVQQRVRAIASLLGDAPQRQAFAERSRGLVDGYGAGRVADTLAGHDKICSE
ncbi:UDP-2,4-diacetamido-2,4,6-trideoxy-beta-L-altropyranose hydrolase [Pseudomonas sp. LP_7_YM]|uniref:UDP-2,4-diacetamido-2,4, 6-trideoxy-beta-L-altropyranose hydrolase n=1 Tax=Pseudomonas sp. LP_7_YM TaxID=2485137 RepID=UPI00105CFFA4|nr:UDP-2,4-diacetamido-2,4,6-trideoxy-beta-L-altropyranose hydrolase [Pseudomonas sp. LP_7_YM]TDV68002.1 UDP-2,4-diacetamido-2,4,6-trideoxy-beta-L-altropyranose hydrolase [Pseudomonas sp. LP_7_YM]